MRWKIYAWFYALSGILSAYLLITRQIDLPVNIPLAYIDYALSIVAAIGIFLFAFGKKTANTLPWKILAAVFISYDILFNLITGPTESHGVVIDTLSMAFGFALMIPAYIALVLYSQGKVNTHKKVTTKPSKKQTVYFYKDPKNAALLSFFTLGLYNTYWFYKHWRSIKDSTGVNTHPVLSAIFSVFTVYSLLTRIINSAKKHKHKARLNAYLLTFLFIAPSIALTIMILSSPIERVPVIIWQVAMVIDLLLTCYIIYSIQKAANYNNEIVLGKKISKPATSSWEMMFAVFGIIIFASYTLLISNKIINNKFPTGTMEQIRAQEKVANDLMSEYNSCTIKLNIKAETVDATNQSEVDAYNVEYDKCDDIRIRQNEAVDEYNILSGY